MSRIGVDDALLVSVPGQEGHRLLPGVVKAWQSFYLLAEKEGFRPCIVSSYRSFDRQLQIWNEKAAGRRPVLDADEQPMDVSAMDEDELMYAILRWSALPGFSRHHWGTDLDICDSSSISSQYQVKLTQAETRAGGVFETFYEWLDPLMKQDLCGFWRPYDGLRGGVALEPWHLSHRVSARDFEDSMSKNGLRDFLGRQELALKDVVLANFDELYQRFMPYGD
ncbi:MAG: M15 family metallopeptidase [Pseudomonadales bacterium]